MTESHLVARYFGGETWTRLARMLTVTAQRHCHGWRLDIERVLPAPVSSPLGSRVAVVNTQKLTAWGEVVARAQPGDRLLLIDADVLILRPLDDVWDLPFDLAYTTKPKDARFPFNAGVLFLRVSASVQAFVARWVTANGQMMTDPAYHQVWRPAFGGINQAALGMLFRTGAAAGLRIQQLPCAEWNCEDETWAHFDPDRTRMVHVKSDLQRAILDRGAIRPEMRPLIHVWHEIERAEAADPVVPIVARRTRRRRAGGDEVSAA